MKIEDVYSGIELNPSRRTIPRRLILTGISLGVFTLMWLIIPHSALYWLLLLPSGILVWMASHGWRHALDSIHDLIHHVDENDDGGL